MFDCSPEMIGKRVKKLRTQHNQGKKRLTQETFAKEIGYSREQVAKWESGVQPLRPEELDKIASFFGVSVDKLVRGTDAENTTAISELGLSNEAIEVLKQMNTKRYKMGVVVDEMLSGDTEVEGFSTTECIEMVNQLLVNPNGNKLLGLLFRYCYTDFDRGFCDGKEQYNLDYYGRGDLESVTSISTSLMRFAVVKAIDSLIDDLRETINLKI